MQNSSLKDMNRHLNNLVDFPDYDEPFCSKIADQFARAKTGLMNEMCLELGIKDYSDIRACNLNKRTVSKEKLCEWLECICFMLDAFAAPHMQCAVNRVEELTLEKNSDQEKIIDLQSQLIEKKEAEISSLQTTVKEEMMSYSAALTKTCAAALAPKKITAAIRTVTEKEDRSKNVIVYGLPESSDEKLSETVSDVISEIGEKPVISDCTRVGIKRPAKIRPVKFSLSNSDIVTQILRKSKLLRTKEGKSSIYFCPDRTADERRAHKKLWDQIKQKRLSEPNKTHIIRENRIISFEKNSTSVKPD